VGFTDFFNRWRLTSDTTGYLFKKEDCLTVGDGDDALIFPLEVLCAFRSMGKVVLTRLDKLQDTVKQKVGFHGWQISFSGTAGNWKASTLPPLPDIPVVGGMIEQGYGMMALLVGMDQIMEVPGWLHDLSEKVLQQESALSIHDKIGLFSELGITHIVFDPNTLEIRPGAGVNEYLWSVSGWSDFGVDIDVQDKLFPTGENEEEG